MPKIVLGKEFWNTEEAVGALGIARQTFHKRVRKQLQTFRFDGLTKPYYLSHDVLALKNGESTREASIVISGVLYNWTDYLQSQGYRAQTLDGGINDAATLPKDAAATFGLPADQRVVKRSRITLANSTRIAAWDTYYPLELVEGEILAQMKAGVASDVPKLIKEQRGVIIGWGKDRYTARKATLEEQQLLELHTDAAVMVVQRANCTKDKSRLVFYQEMTLLGSWFAPEHEYPVTIWDE